MKQCRTDCIHAEACRRYADNSTYWQNGDCPIYKPTTDVVPKSEVDRLETEIRLLTENSILAKYPCCVSCSKGLILTKSLEDYDKLIGDISSSTKIEVARDIITDMREMIKGYENIDIYLDRIEKKYTESEGKG